MLSRGGYKTGPGADLGRKMSTQVKLFSLLKGAVARDFSTSFLVKPFPFHLGPSGCVVETILIGFCIRKILEKEQESALSETAI